MTARTAVAASDLQPLTIGSDEHKRMFCDVLLGTFDPYKPAILAWPKLSADAERRLTSLPFWDVAVETEGYAASRMQAMADRTHDPLIREAISLNAFEEGRHKLVIRNMLQCYDIPLGPEKPYRAVRDPLWNFIRTGYGECFDSFFAFGLFRMAKESGFFPAELVDVFEPVVQEEARHIMFFVNWVAWTAANKTVHARIWFRLLCLAALVMSALNRVSLAGVADKGKSGDDFITSGGETLTTGLTPRRLIEIALEEDKRRMDRYDARLLRPRIMPFLASIGLRFMPQTKPSQLAAAGAPAK